MFGVIMCSFSFLYSISVNRYDNSFAHSTLRDCLCSFQYAQHCGQHSSTLVLVNICKHFRWAYTKGGMNTSQGIHMFRFRRQGQTGFQGGCISLHFYQEYMIVLLVPCFCQKLTFFLYISFCFLKFLWDRLSEVRLPSQSAYVFLTLTDVARRFSKRSV